jgi:hypothetical protein
MDEVHFTRAEGWNTVALVKHLGSARSLAHPRGEGAHG